MHPVREEYRTRRGERDWRVVGFGGMREHGPQLLPEGALASGSAIAQELAIQRAQRRKTGGSPPDEPNW